ncbi:MAG: SDR family oxidoreductase [Hyphomicrobiaceae bacterium]
MSVATQSLDGTVYAEMAGARVLVSGLTPAIGVDLARGFADHKCRLVLQSTDETPAMDALATLLSESAAEIEMFRTPLSSGEAAVRFAQGPAMTFGGLDVAVNLVHVSAADLDGLATIEDVEQLASDRLLAPTLMTRVIANRMRVTMTEGLLLNVVLTENVVTEAQMALVGVLRATLAAMTRREAQAWADQGVRINAVGPRSFIDDGSCGATLSSGPDIAALALYLASRKGRQLSGHVFDAEGIAARGC